MAKITLIKLFLKVCMFFKKILSNFSNKINESSTALFMNYDSYFCKGACNHLTAMAPAKDGNGEVMLVVPGNFFNTNFVCAVANSFVLKSSIRLFSHFTIFYLKLALIGNQSGPIRNWKQGNDAILSNELHYFEAGQKNIDDFMPN